MAEPSSTAVTTGAVAALTLYFGPDAPQYMLILFGALIGTMHSVAKVDFDGRRLAAALYMLRWILTAVILTAFVASLILKYTGFPADRWPGVIAFAITFLADKWPAWLASAGDKWTSLFGSRS